MKNLLLLLDIINRSGNVKKLIYNGISYNEIPTMINDAIDKEFLIFNQNKIQLTEIGLDFLNQNFEIIKKSDKNEWIEKDKNNKIAKLDKNIIFVPLQNELSF